MNYKYIALSFFFILSCFINIKAQEDERTLARIGLVEITVEEFRNRYEFMPHLNYSSDDPDSLKKEFLYSMITEKLWYLEALTNRLDTIKNIKYSLETLKKLFLKDELYRREVESKIKISPEEIASGLLHISRVLNTEVITSLDSAEIFTFYSSLKFGIPFDSLRDASGNRVGKTEVKISFGKLQDENLEDIVFSLRTGTFSEPVFSNNTWFIIKLNSEEPNAAYDKNPDHARNMVYSVIKERKANKLSGTFLDNLIGGKSITADKELFLLFSDTLYSVITGRIIRSSSDSASKIELVETDLINTMRLLKDAELDSPFINLPGKPAALREFIFYLIYIKTAFNSPEKNNFRKVLNSAVKQFIEDEMLSRKAVEDGLEKLESLKKDHQVWKEFYLAETMMQKFSSSVELTETDIAVFREKSLQWGEEMLYVNIIEILTDQLLEIESVLSGLDEGKHFKDLADVYNKRELTKKSGGEWGYFPAAAGGEIGRVAAEMNIGEIYGPLKVPGGYSIFKLIGKEKRKTGIKDTVDTGIINMQFMLAKMNQLINSKTVTLANKFGISADLNLLQKTEVSGINTFTYRLIGFGGKIAALPITIPMFEWYKVYIDKKEMP